MVVREHATAPPNRLGNEPACEWREFALIALKAAHTAIWFGVEANVGYLLFAGFRRRSDRRAAIAGSVVAVESLVFLGNGAHCPLTGVAERLGAERGSVTDIFLPAWLARNLPVLHVPLLLLAVALHRRNLADQRS